MGGGIPCGGQQPGHRLCRLRPAPVDVGQLRRIAQRLDDQLPGGASVTAGQRERAQALPQPPLGQRVGSAQRRVQQRDRRLLVQAGRFERAAQQEQQWRDRRLQVQGQVLAVHHGGYAGSVQCPPQGGQLQRGGPHQHRHPRPRHAVEQVGRAQRVGQPGRLAGRRAERVHLDHAGRRVRQRVQAAVRRRAAQPATQPGDRREQTRPGPVRRGQQHLCGRRPGGGPEAVREGGHPGRVGAPEGVRGGIRVGERDK